MCKSRFNDNTIMVTPTKSKQYYQQRPQGKHSHSPMTTPPRNGHYRKNTPSPTSDGFKTPQNPRTQGSNPKILASRCVSEPLKSKKKPVGPQVTHRTSPLNFAGAKCLEPPTPTSLPRPPTTWVKDDKSFSAKQALSFEDLVVVKNQNGVHQDLDPLSQQLRMLLKVQ